MIVPVRLSGSDDRRRADGKKQAEREVRAKYPKLLEGSTGWHRAVENRFRRIKY